MTTSRLKTVVEADFSYLINCDRQRTFSCTPLFAPFGIPLLLEKLSSSLRRAKVEQVHQPLVIVIWSHYECLVWLWSLLVHCYLNTMTWNTSCCVSDFRNQQHCWDSLIASYCHVCFFWTSMCSHRLCLHWWSRCCFILNPCPFCECFRLSLMLKFTNISPEHSACCFGALH